MTSVSNTKLAKKLSKDSNSTNCSQLYQVLWKFPANHIGHNTEVRLEDDMTDKLFGYQEIGGDTDQDISFETYLAG